MNMQRQGGVDTENDPDGVTCFINVSPEKVQARQSEAPQPLMLCSEQSRYTHVCTHTLVIYTQTTR